MDEVPKIVTLDANALICLIEKDSIDSQKLEHLLGRIDSQKGRVILPTPALAEYLVNADQAGLAAVEKLAGRSSVVIASFDLAAAFEVSQMEAAARNRGDKRDGVDDAWQKVKYDRQIVAIAKGSGSKLIVSDDAGVRAAAARVGIRCVTIAELELPDELRQGKLGIPPLDQDA